MNHREYAESHGVDLNSKDPAFELANLITQARLYAGLTQGELAYKVKTSFEHIKKLESGTEEPTVKFLLALAEAIGVELELPRFVFPEESKKGKV